MLALLAVEVLLWLSERFGWLGWHKAYAVLTCVASVGVAMLLMLVWFAVALVFRWRFQFSLRTLLLLVVVAAVPCSWLAACTKDAKTQRTVVDSIESAGGDAYFYDRENKCQFHYHTWNLRSSPLLPSWAVFDLYYSISHVFYHPQPANFDRPQTIIIQENGNFSEQITLITKLRHLRCLGLAGTTVDDACLEQLAKMGELERLYLQCTKVTSMGVAKLKQSLPNVEIGWGWDRVKYQHGSEGAEYTTFQEDNAIANEKDLTRLELSVDATDAELIRLSEFGRLKSLSLRNTKITDAGLQYLKRLTQLQTLDLRGTNASIKGIKKLQQALPNCEIVY
ncbi:MAG: hypothetical protein ABSG53_04320 [Thermoguttaceae bacterium]